MAKYAEDDCRNHGGPIIGKPQTFDFIIETNKIGRHERRRIKALAGRKNTRGYPSGFNAKSWGQYTSSTKRTKE